MGFEVYGLINSENLTNELSASRRARATRGLGTFSVRRHRGYGGRNPKTGESIDVEPKRLPHFRPGAELRVRINLRTSENVGRLAPVAHAAAKGVPSYARASFPDPEGPTRLIMRTS